MPAVVACCGEVGATDLASGMYRPAEIGFQIGAFLEHQRSVATALHAYRANGSNLLRREVRTMPKSQRTRIENLATLGHELSEAHLRLAAGGRSRWPGTKIRTDVRPGGDVEYDYYA
jgi:hypothetical protein